MTDPAVRRELTELFAGQGWPDGGDALLRRSLGPRSPELLLDAPGWLGLRAGGLVLDAGCRDAGHAIALARRYGCRVLGQALPVADGACDLVWCRDTRPSPPGSRWSGVSGSAASGPSTGWSTIPATSPRTCWRWPGSPATGRVWRPRWGRSGTGAPWRSPSGARRSCSAGSCPSCTR